MQREIKRMPPVPLINKELIELLTRLCFIDHAPQPVDLIFVFGTNVLQEKVAGLIRDLLLVNCSTNVLITGGIANYQETSHAEVAESDLILAHIDPGKYNGVHFLQETRSKNTLENVLYGNEVIELSSFNSLLCISHSYASRRSVQTLKNLFSKSIYSCPYDIYSDQPAHLVTKHNWWLSEAGRSLVWGEYLRFALYGQRGDFVVDNEIIDLLHTIKSLVSN